MLGILEKISPSELVPNGYISNHNTSKVRRPCPKFKVSFFYTFLLFLNKCYSNKLWKHQKKIQRIISDNCFQLKLWFNVDARAPSISHYWTSPLNDSLWQTNTFVSFSKYFANGFVLVMVMFFAAVVKFLSLQTHYHWVILESMHVRTSIQV